MPNEPKADWGKEAVSFTNRHDLDVKLTLRHRRAVESALADALRSAHAAGAREAEEKLGRAMVVVETCVGWQNLNDDCLLCWPNKSGEKGMTHSEHCPLAIQGFINRDASRVVGKETK